MPLYTPKSFDMPFNEAQLRAILQEYDRNRDGRLSKEELKQAFEKLGSRNPDWRARRALHHADANKDGHVAGEYEFNQLVQYALERGYRVG